MDLVPVEAPAAGMALAGETLEFFDAALGIVSASDGLQVVADQLVEAFAKGLRLFACAGDKLFIDGEGDVHAHSIRVHVLCVNVPVSNDEVNKVTIPTLVAKYATRMGHPRGIRCDKS